MVDVKTVNGKTYVRLNCIRYALIPEEIKNLLDEAFAEKIVKAFQAQVEANHGWGFTVRYKGYRVRFDLENATKNKIPIIYEGYVEEAPQTTQTVLTEALAQ